MRVHPIEPNGLEKPSCFNNPFDYEPHPLCLLAADEVKRYLTTQPALLGDAQQGKMFGVLIVEQEADGKETSNAARLGFLAAYSGLLAGRNDWPYFVPPVFDAQQPDGHFKQTERIISSINDEVKSLPSASPRLNELKQQRKQLSEELQLWLFRQYRMLNAFGEEKDLIEIWRNYHPSAKIQQRFPLPPGGSGDCCAPKLLQYAYQHHLHPIAIAEFWFGQSPKAEIRHHNQFYPACRGKCLPILTHMLQGLGPVGTLKPQADLTGELKTIYEDDTLLVVDKPSGLLSVPGRIDAPSVQSVLMERYGSIFMPHRLDMDTSGLMVVARTEEAYKHLQQQFYSRSVSKRYLALLNRQLPIGQEGTIALPLRPDPLDRPRQVVDLLHGKQATTDYRVLPSSQALQSEYPNTTLISLTPHTGRTHQLRVHCAHPNGLNAPIVGDALYGQKAHRLCLHAAELSFQHPVSGARLHFESTPNF